MFQNKENKFNKENKENINTIWIPTDIKPIFTKEKQFSEYLLQRTKGEVNISPKLQLILLPPKDKPIHPDIQNLINCDRLKGFDTTQV